MPKKSSWPQDMEINGIAHTFLTAGDYGRSREFYSKLLPYLGMKPVLDGETTCRLVIVRRVAGLGAGQIEPDQSLVDEPHCGLGHFLAVGVVSQCAGNAIQHDPGFTGCCTEPIEEALKAHPWEDRKSTW